MALTNGGTPYVVYSDAVNGFRATVRRFNGTSWVTVGSPGFSQGATAYTSIAFTTGNIPYVAFKDWFTADGRATVMHLINDNWTLVGSARFTPGESNFTKIVMAPGNIPHLSYSDALNGGKASVMKFTSGTWSYVGSPLISSGIANDTDMVIDAYGTHSWHSRISITATKPQSCATLNLDSDMQTPLSSLPSPLTETCF
jgi:hypothetical protein